MSTQDQSPAEAHLIPDPSQKIHWAVNAMEEKVDALQTRNWITEDLIRFSQKHWHCTREQALQRMLTQDA